MRLDRESGWALVVANSVVRQVEFAVERNGRARFVGRSSGAVEFDYLPLADVYYWHDGEGMPWKAAIHVLAATDQRDDLPDAASIALPDLEEMRDGTPFATLLVMEALNRREIEADEVDHQMAFARNLVATPASIYAEWHLIGDARQAQLSLVEKELAAHREFVATIRGAQDGDEDDGAAS